MRQELENLIIDWGSIPIAILICGSIAPEVRVPVKEALSKVYSGVKTVGEELRRLLYNDNSLLYCI